MAMRCLIVDDSACFLRSAQVLLERQGITVVGMASTIAEALQRADELQPDVVLVDIALGQESGFDLAHRLDERARAETNERRPRIILISTRPREDFEERIAASPAVGFLGKPALCAQAIHDLLSGRGT